MGGDLQLALDVISILAVLGVSIGIFLSIVFGFIKFGFQYSLWIVLASLVIWYIT
jgi:hypothetical protein